LPGPIPTCELPLVYHCISLTVLQSGGGSVPNLMLARNRPALRWMVQEAKKYGLKIDDLRFRRDLNKRNSPDPEHNRKPPSVATMGNTGLRFWKLKHQTQADGPGQSTDNTLVTPNDPDDISVHETSNWLWSLLEYLPFRRLDNVDSTSTTYW
jgi:hypothetical protein